MSVVCFDGLVPRLPPQHKVVQFDISWLHGRKLMGTTYDVQALWKQWSQPSRHNIDDAASAIHGGAVRLIRRGACIISH